MKKVKQYIVKQILNVRDLYNRIKLTNKAPMIIANNCLGGFIYHWLGCQFKSPFINLSMTPSDFVTALENFQEFMNYDILEDKKLSEENGFPVGSGYADTKIYFSHYDCFENAKEKWNLRKARMDRELQNGGVYLYDTKKIVFLMSLGKEEDDDRVLCRFDKLSYPYKVSFVSKKRLPIHLDSCISIKNYDPSVGGLWTFDKYSSVVPYKIL